VAEGASACEEVHSSHLPFATRQNTHTTVNNNTLPLHTTS